MQALDLRVTTFGSSKISNMFWKLEQLRHLYLPRDFSLSGNKLWLDDLGNLQTLVNISSKYFNLNDLVKLTNLKKLKIYTPINMGERIFKPTSTTTKQLSSLQSLVIVNGFKRVNLTPLISSCPQIYKLRLYGKIVKLPDDHQFSPNIIKLTLYKTRLKDDPMATLEKLPSLRILSFGYKAFKGNAMVCSNGGFPLLESLSFLELESFYEWRVEEGALRNLRSLHIGHCSYLSNIPNGLRSVTTLKEMVIQTMPREFRLRVEEGGEDFLKVQHVPSIIFQDC